MSKGPVSEILEARKRETTSRVPRARKEQKKEVSNAAHRKGWQIERTPDGTGMLNGSPGEGGDVSIYEENHSPMQMKSKARGENSWALTPYKPKCRAGDNKCEERGGKKKTVDFV